MRTQLWLMLVILASAAPAAAAATVPLGAIPRTLDEARDTLADIDREERELREDLRELERDCREDQRDIRERARDADDRRERRDVRDDLRDLRRQCDREEDRIKDRLDLLRKLERSITRITGNLRFLDRGSIRDIVHDEAEVRAKLAELEARCELDERILQQRARFSYDRDDRRDVRDDLRDLRRDCNDERRDLREDLRDLERDRRDATRGLHYRGGGIGLARYLLR